MKQTFKKSERLTNKKDIDAIFEKGLVIKSFPLLVKHLPINFEDGAGLKVVISVPKRRIRKATDRNRIRRQMKEAFRLNKMALKEVLKKRELSLALFFVYTGKEKPDYAQIEGKIKLILKELNNTYLKYTAQSSEK